MPRSNEKEWIDLGCYTQEEYEDALMQLERIGRFLGGDRATFHALKNLSFNSILDVGCGGGFFTKKMAEKYPQAQVVGSDLSKGAIRFAEKRHQAPNLRFTVETPQQKFDLITATLVCHHMSDAELIAFIQWATSKAKWVVLNDLHRHRLAPLGFWLFCKAFISNKMIQHDGLVSIQRAFTRQDWIKLLHAAGIEKFRITWHWAFRWIVLIF